MATIIFDHIVKFRVPICDTVTRREALIIAGVAVATADFEHVESDYFQEVEEITIPVLNHRCFGGALTVREGSLEILSDHIEFYASQPCVYIAQDSDCSAAEIMACVAAAAELVEPASDLTALLTSSSLDMPFEILCHLQLAATTVISACR